MLLIEEHKTEFKQLLNGSSAKKKAITKKKNDANMPTASVEKERVPYHEMPFWKANPHLKPYDAKERGYGMTLEAFKELQAFFKEPGNEVTDEWLEMLD